MYVTSWITGRYVTLIKSQELTQVHKKRVFNNTQIRNFNEQNNKVMQTLRELSIV